MKEQCFFVQDVRRGEAWLF